MKKQILCAFFCTVAVLLSLRCSVSAERANLTPEDADFLVRSVAAEYGEISYAARVCVIAVIINRVESGLYPKTAAGVIGAYRNADGSLRFNKKSLDASEKAMRMTRDAYFSVMNGGDITEGAMNFELIEEIPRKLDFDFDDHGEDEHARDTAERCRRYKLVTDGVGFW